MFAIRICSQGEELYIAPASPNYMPHWVCGWLLHKGRLEKTPQE